jgi:ribosome-binding protein aMBF1 (putative translation factor)
MRFGFFVSAWSPCLGVHIIVNFSGCEKFNSTARPVAPVRWKNSSIRLDPNKLRRSSGVLIARSRKILKTGYQEFKIGLMLRQAREQAGVTQEKLARLTRTRKSAISRLENHAEDVRLSTVARVAKALGKVLRVELVEAK